MAATADDVRNALSGVEPPALGQALTTFYENRDYAFAWTTPQARSLAAGLGNRMRSAESDGLLSGDYDPDDWMRRLNPCGPADVDVGFSGVVLRYLMDRGYGAGGSWESERETNIIEELTRALDGASALELISAVEPRHSEYADLRMALREYREIQARGGWSEVPDGEAIHLLIARLTITGDLPPGPYLVEQYDEVLESAVRRFQQRHGILVDGIVGPQTIATMNVPVEDRVGQIAANMNRWRRLPDELGSPHVMVNIAGFRLKAAEDGAVIRARRVVAGKRSTPTPVMSDRISYLVFRPYWNIPNSITRNELLPRIADDPGYLHEQQMEVVDGWDAGAPVLDPYTIDWGAALESFPYRLRQRPGPHNSLGLVKFMFPNQHSVYLHDTPATHRFESWRRAFSHGCVRVEDPVSLAEFLLRDDPAWDRAGIERAMQSGSREIVRLPEPVPVYLQYFTAWREGGEVHFRPDIYGLDEGFVRRR